MKKLLFVLALLLASGGAVLAETPYFSTSVSNITDTSAKLRGSVGGDPDGIDAVGGPYYYFEYGTTNSVNSTTPQVSELDELTLYAEITGLQSDTTYYYRFVEKVDYEDDNQGYTYDKSPMRTFRTLDENPTVLSGDANLSARTYGITDTTVTLIGNHSGERNYNATVVGPYYYFEYGTTNSVNSKTPETSELVTNTCTNGGCDHEDFARLYANLTNLEPDTTYYYRFVEKIGSTQGSGYTYYRSEIKSFRTNEEDESGLTDAQIEGLEDLGFTQVQIDRIIALFEKKDGPQGLACGYRHLKTLRHGMSGEDIKEMQKALKLNADGKFGRMTAEAVKRFQAEHGLPADGVIGPKTGLKLGLLCHAE